MFEFRSRCRCCRRPRPPNAPHQRCCASPGSMHVVVAGWVCGSRAPTVTKRDQTPAGSKTRRRCTACAGRCGRRAKRHRGAKISSNGCVGSPLTGNVCFLSFFPPHPFFRLKFGRFSCVWRDCRCSRLHLDTCLSNTSWIQECRGVHFPLQGGSLLNKPKSRRQLHSVFKIAG